MCKEMITGEVRVAGGWSVKGVVSQPVWWLVGLSVCDSCTFGFVDLMSAIL